MSTAARPTQPRSPSTDSVSEAEFDRLIEQQLQRTAFQVKLADGASGLLRLGIGLLGAAFLLVLIDHWLHPLTAGMRWCAWILLLLGIGWSVVRKMVPLIWQEVNPIYAARTIERAEPALKNSLVNFLSFRLDRAGLRQAVYAALRQQAANDVTHADVDMAVDRGPVIRLGYVFAALSALFAAYAILSPKSPIQSAMRVMAPWAEIATPTRVRIEDIQPGDHEVYRGETARITATCYDVWEEETVSLVVSSDDGRITRQSIPMERLSDGLRYACDFPRVGAGIQESVTYWIEAGDACSASYRLEVVSAPTIVVDRIDYSFPAYTGKSPITVRGQGDIQALEGTHVRIHARANMRLQSATLEFDPLMDSPVAAQLAMNVDQDAATVAFLLKLDDARTGPQHSGYQLRCRAMDDQPSRQPVVHRIDVVRDLSPEIEVLTPNRHSAEVREDGHQTIEVRALDPDFGLRGIQLRAVVGGQQLLDVALLDNPSPSATSGQAIVQYDFRPKAFGLAAGDLVTFWCVATDNRTSADGSEPLPNTARTDDYRLRIVPGEPTPAESVEDNPSTTPANMDDPNESEQGDSKSDASDGSSTAGDEQAGNTADSSDADDQGEAGGQEGTAGSSSNGEQGNSGERGGSSANESGKATGQGGPENDATGGNGDSSGSNEPPASGGTQDALSDSDGQPQHASDASGEAGSSRSQGTIAEGVPQESEPLHDGEVIEETLEYMQEHAADTEGRKTDRQGIHGTPEAGTVEDGHATDEQLPEDLSSDPTDRNQGPGDARDASGSPSGTPQGDMQNKQDTAPSNGMQETEKQPGQGANSESGAGQTNDEEEASAASEFENRDGNNTKSPGGDSQDGNRSRMPSQSQRSSDSQSTEGGDRSGGGQQGSGQGANQQGHDSAGNNSSADDGQGASDESGSGETADRPGDQVAGTGQTADNTTSDTAGNLSSDSPTGHSPGGAAADQGQSQDSAENQRSGTPGQGTEQAEFRRGGGGQPGENRPPGFEAVGEVPDGEAANLEYARKSTDLVLEYLRDQQQKPDPELLDRLQWTPSDLQRFLKKWDALKANAREEPLQQQALNDSLRSLGLRPAATQTHAIQTRPETASQLRVTGNQSTLPQAYRDQFRAYRKGTARVAP